jgi:hypothetical protein
MENLSFTFALDLIHRKHDLNNRQRACLTFLRKPKAVRMGNHLQITFSCTIQNKGLNQTLHSATTRNSRHFQISVLN